MRRAKHEEKNSRKTICHAKILWSEERNDQNDNIQLNVPMPAPKKIAFKSFFFTSTFSSVVLMFGYYRTHYTTEKNGARITIYGIRFVSTLFLYKPNFIILLWFFCFVFWFTLSVCWGTHQTPICWWWCWWYFVLFVQTVFL